jgi:hypothetical protein
VPEYLSGIELDYGLNDQWFESRQGLGHFLFTTASGPALGPTQPPIQWVPGTFSLELKWPGSEADHSPPPSAEVKEWVELYLHSPNYAFMEWCSVMKKAQGQLHRLPLLYWIQLVLDRVQWRDFLNTVPYYSGNSWLAEQLSASQEILYWISLKPTTHNSTSLFKLFKPESAWPVSFNAI